MSPFAVTLRSSLLVLGQSFCLLSFVACGGGTNESAPAGEISNGADEVSDPDLDLVIDDFEDGNQTTLIGGPWYSYDDNGNGGLSSIEFPRDDGGQVIMAGEGFESEHSLLVEFSFDQGALPYQPYVGLGTSLGSAGSPFDLSDYGALEYTYRGSAHGVRLETSDVTDYDFHVVSVPASVSWRTVELALPLFTQEGWGEPVPFNPAHILALSFHLRGETGGMGSLEIDNLGAIEQVANGEPDMEVREVEPPERLTLESLEIENPLQELARDSLDKGYNITNWLEQGRFEGFDYDEEFVARLADAGFESLRLPIDLDLYVEQASGTGEGLELSVHDDLFTVLDSFDAWTAEYGLSLTIDYHQYDRSLDFSDEDSMAEAVALWGVVAEHFADNSREDLFFELLNEPELSVAGTAPSEEQWSELAERMIAAIREHDATRTIIFGDVEWYGIGPLSRREPLSDDNVIYAFHFYEPFIFTHQGASWANLGTAHDVPFPYAADRWSEYFSDLGFTPFMESWILGDVRSYYRDGTPEAVFNRIVAAKQWAVDNDVPVICNEFGAYDATSRLEDRERYYTELVGIFEELEIPWQHWFMILDDDGSVLSEYREAFGLD